MSGTFLADQSDFYTTSEWINLHYSDQHLICEILETWSDFYLSTCLTERN